MTARGSVANTLPFNTEVIAIYNLKLSKGVCHLLKTWQTLWQTPFPRTVRLEHSLPGKWRSLVSHEAVPVGSVRPINRSEPASIRNRVAVARWCNSRPYIYKEDSPHRFGPVKAASFP
jgi:hypothetical protein